MLLQRYTNHPKWGFWFKNSKRTRLDRKTKNNLLGKAICVHKRYIVPLFRKPLGWGILENYIFSIHRFFGIPCKVWIYAWDIHTSRVHKY